MSLREKVVGDMSAVRICCSFESLGTAERPA
jgi:hypothetical protein